MRIQLNYFDREQRIDICFVEMNMDTLYMYKVHAVLSNAYTELILALVEKKMQHHLDWFRFKLIAEISETKGARKFYFS